MSRRKNDIRAKFSFHIPIYNARLWFVVARDMQAGVDALPSVLHCEAGSCRGVYIVVHPDYGIVVTDPSHDTITHEVSHVGQHLMENIGFKIVPVDGNPNDEPLSYLNGWISGQIARRLAKAKITYLTD